MLVLTSEWNIGEVTMSKWDDWYHNQNEATQAWLDAQAKEDNKLILMGMFCGFVLGFVISTLLWL